MGKFVNDFEIMDSEFDDRSVEELYADFLGKTEKSNEEFIYYYGRFYNAMSQLTGSAMSLMTWLTFHCGVNSGRVIIQSFTLKDALRDLECSIGTYYKSINLLKSLDMIKGGNATYYVNPAYAWKGTADMRAKFMKIYPKL